MDEFYPSEEVVALSAVIWIEDESVRTKALELTLACVEFETLLIEKKAIKNVEPTAKSSTLISKLVNISFGD